MIIGVGTDILCAKRFTEAVKRRGIEAWKNKLLGKAELQEFSALSIDTSKMAYLCARFTIKESIYKAGYPIYKFTWKDINILNNKTTSPKPVVYLLPSVKENLKIHVSLSHEKDGKYVSIAVMEQID